MMVVLAAGGVITVALARRASAAGLPFGEVVETVCVTLALATLLTVGVTLVVALGACLVDPGVFGPLYP